MLCQRVYMQHAAQVLIIAPAGVHLLVKEEEEADPKAHAVSRRRVVLHSHSSVRLELSYRLYPDPFSNASNEYVARYARS